MGVFIFYYLLYRPGAVPGFIAIWGAFGIATLVISTFVKLAGTSIPVVNYFLVLIISNEIFLAVWLMIKWIRTDGKNKLPADTINVNTAQT